MASQMSSGKKPQSYKDLEIFQLSKALAIRVHRMTLERLPKFEMFEEGSQIRRSCKSIEINIVEGFGRKRYQGEYVKYLTYALSECDETKEHLNLLFETGSLTDQTLYQDLYQSYETLGRKIHRFREAVANNNVPPIS